MPLSIAGHLSFSEMRAYLFFAIALMTGCASRPTVSENPPMKAGGPNWEEVDKSVQRVKEREANKARFVETSRTVEQGFKPMSDAEYDEVLAQARANIKNNNPNISDSELEKQATAVADEKRRESQLRYSASASSTYEWKKP